jgi:PAS domain S-box-containing protein
MINKRTYGVLVLAFLCLCAFLFYSFYNEARNVVIRHTNETQMVHAKLAARGIEEYFTSWVKALTTLSKSDHIIDNDEDGKNFIKVLSESYPDEVLSINRVSENGIIIYSSDKRRLQTDVSGQKHIHELLNDHHTVISDVFTTDEGENAISVQVPVFKGVNFKGSIGVLINFRSITNRYLAEIKIGKTGHAWVISQGGIELYSPEPGFIGKSITESLKGYSSMTPMLAEMLKGHQGYATYQFDKASGHNIKMTSKLAVYVPVHLKNTIWSIVVVTNRDEALQSLVSFKNRLIFIMVVFSIVGIIAVVYGSKAWKIVKEEGKRKNTEALLKEREEQYRNIYDNALEGIFQITLEGKCFKANKALAKMLAYDSPEAVVSLLKPFSNQFWVNTYERTKFINLFEKQDVIIGFEAQLRRIDDEVIWVSLNCRLLHDEQGNKLYYEGFILDITVRKENELIIKNKLADLQWHYDIAINRELRMSELKEEVNSLLIELNKEKKYRG